MTERGLTYRIVSYYAHKTKNSQVRHTAELGWADARHCFANDNVMINSKVGIVAVTT